MNSPRVSVRDAIAAELPTLQEMLYRQRHFYEQQDLSKAIVKVAEFGEETVGFGAARLTWQVEPILLGPRFKKFGPHFAQQKATYLLIRELDRWIADRQRNLTGLHSYFCSIPGQRMQELALSFGMVPVYKNSKFFGRDT